MASSGLLGVVLLARHGDRSEFQQDPVSYESSRAVLTPYGQAQEVQLGAFLRSEYLNPNSASFINGISTDLADDRQVRVRADNGGEGNVIVDSAGALLQGLFPPTPKSKIHLANGSIVLGPFGGYQYLPIETVEPGQSIQLEGWSQCPAFDAHTKQFYDSPAFKKKADQAASYLEEIKPYLYGRPNTLENAWNIFDFLNVQFTHNETFAYRLPPTYLAQAQDLANFHEHGVFTDTRPDGIGNVAGRTILPSIIDGLERISNPQDPLKFLVQEISYKPFISLFNLTNIDVRYPELGGIPNYGSALAFELRKNEDGDVILRTKFKNGTADDTFRALHLFDHREDIPLNEFVYRLDLSALQGVPDWCKACNQRSARGCSMCSSNLEVPAKSYIPLIGNGNGSGASCVPLLGAQSMPFFALFAFILVAFFGLFKLVNLKTRRPRLPGYDALPTTAQYYDEAPTVTKQRM